MPEESLRGDAGRAAGVPGDRLGGDRAAARLRELFPSGCRVVFLHAHPDDETLSTGVLVAGLAAAGHPVAVVTATRGERGEVRPGVEVEGDLIGHRLGELASALAALGVAEHCFLGAAPARRAGAAPRIYTDSGMRWMTPTLAGPAADAGADSLTAAEAGVPAPPAAGSAVGVGAASGPGERTAAPAGPAEAADPSAPDGPATDLGEPASDLVAYLTRFGADVLVGYDSYGGYGHPDHVACHRIAVAAAAAAGVRLVEVVSGPLLDPALPDPKAVAYREPAQDASVRRALGCYASQLQVDGDDVVHVGGQRQPIADTVWLRPMS